MAKFNDGDVVVLKSGGPVMTVGGMESGHGRAVCLWFVGKDFRSTGIAHEALRRATDEEAKASQAEFLPPGDSGTASK